MSGKIFKAIFMMLVLSLAFLITTPAFSGEHPWDSDQFTKDTVTSFDPDLGDTITIVDTTKVSSTDPDDGSSSSVLPEGWVSVVVQVIYTLSSVF